MFFAVLSPAFRLRLWRKLIESSSAGLPFRALSASHGSTGQPSESPGRTGRGGPWLTPRNAPTLPVAAPRTATRNTAALIAKGSPTKPRSFAPADITTAPGICKLPALIRSAPAARQFHSSQKHFPAPGHMLFLPCEREFVETLKRPAPCRPFSFGVQSCH